MKIEPAKILCWTKAAEVHEEWREDFLAEMERLSVTKMPKKKPDIDRKIGGRYDLIAKALRAFISNEAGRVAMRLLGACRNEIALVYDLQDFGFGRSFFAAEGFANESWDKKITSISPELAAEHIVIASDENTTAETVIQKIVQELDNVVVAAEDHRRNLLVPRPSKTKKKEVHGKHVN